MKRKIGNKGRVEGSICNAYLKEEISSFCSLYFEQPVDTKANDLTVGVTQEGKSELPKLYQSLGEGSTIKGKTRFLCSEEYELAHLYVPSNLEILREYEMWVYFYLFPA